MNNSDFLVVAVIVIAGTTAAIAHCLGADGSQIAAWVQAVGSIAAVTAAFFVASNQSKDQAQKDERDRRAIAYAAYQLAFQAFDLVGDRLDAAIHPSEKIERYLLRGSRTTEMVLAMREFDTQRLPPQLLADFILLRSQIYATNARISDVYAEEERDGAQRPPNRADNLGSARKVYREARLSFERLAATATGEFGANMQALTARPRLA
jgi:hypothetical protein